VKRWETWNNFQSLEMDDEKKKRTQTRNVYHTADEKEHGNGTRLGGPEVKGIR